MSTQALALSLWLPDVVLNTPNVGDVVTVSAVPVGGVPMTQFSPAGSGGAGGAGLPSPSHQGQVLVSGSTAPFPPAWSDIDAGRF